MMNKNNLLNVNFSGINLDNPLVLASGVLGISKEYFSVLIENGVGAITIKSISKEARGGHTGPVLLAFAGGLMNAVGYSNPGIEDAIREFGDLKDIKVPVIASIIGQNAAEFGYMAENFLPYDFTAVELALSCPHTPGFGTMAGQNSPKSAYKITRAVYNKTNLPIIVKLSPNVENLGDIAKAVEDAGASAISACNSLGPGMVINIDTATPFLNFQIGGVSGPALKPIAVRCVFDIYKAVKIPILGIGGITTGKDAIEMMMAGAASVGVGSAVYYRGVEVFNKIKFEMEEWLIKNSYSSINEIMGLAHEK